MCDKYILYFFPVGNKCFSGNCDYYCTTGHSRCGNPVMLEGSVAAYLPSALKLDRNEIQNPYVRSYRYANSVYNTFLHNQNVLNSSLTLKAVFALKKVHTSSCPIPSNHEPFQNFQINPDAFASKFLEQS